ncbi:MAG: transcriptional repressor [Anaeroplasmataceae bacterium]|nr:transcriptional repressor [Anaeroplasmataceae bacterium]
MYQTNHQKIILDFFKSHQDQAFTAQALIDRFQGQINKATIYRKLHLLEENKMVRKSYNDMKKSYEYQYALDCENHLHLICKECGKIIHLKCDQTSSFVSHLSNQHGFLIDQRSTMIFGVCEGCKSHA